MGAGARHRGRPARSLTSRGRGAPRCGPGRAAPVPRRGGRGSREAEAPLRAPTQPSCHLPRCAARPGASPPRKIMPLPPAQTRSEPCGRSTPLRLPPNTSRPGGRDGEEAAGPPAAGAPAPPPPVAATGTFVWRPLRLPRGGRGATKNPSQTEVRGPGLEALPRTAAADLLRLPPGRRPGGGRRGGKLWLKTLPQLRRPCSSLRTRLTGKHRFPPPRPPLPLLPSPRLFSPPLPLSRMLLRRSRIG